MGTKQDINFLFEMGNIRYIHRMWERFFTNDFANLAEHHFRMFWIAMIIAGHEKNVDTGKIAKMVLVHDIPETVKNSVREATMAGASLITVHASGGQKMLDAAREGAEEGRENITDVFKRRSISKLGHVLGITVLTSLDAVDCESIFGIPQEDEAGIKKKVIQFAHMVLDAGLTGIVCSPLEATAIRANSDFDSLLVVTPGITPVFAKAADDQKRTTSAIEAINNGADLIVVGRAINNAVDYGLTKAQAAAETGIEIKTGLGL